MEVISARNVNDAFTEGLELLGVKGVSEDSRAGRVRVIPTPVTTVYQKPWERVLFNPVRNANPFFHLMEALWMLAGRRDAAWLDQFVSDFSKRFAEDDGLQHGAYGFRWLKHFEPEGGWGPGKPLPDQLTTIVSMLKANPQERRAVLAMWDPMADLGAQKRDIPCNTHVYFRVRREHSTIALPIGGYHLDMTVCCRSNDMIWGAYGANAVHFSILQEYMARRLGIGVGVYYQISNNFHAYEAVLSKQRVELGLNPYSRGVQPTPIVEDAQSFDLDLAHFFAAAYNGTTTGLSFGNRFFPLVALPMVRAAAHWRAKQYTAAYDLINSTMLEGDWKLACIQWMDRRMPTTEKPSAAQIS